MNSSIKSKASSTIWKPLDFYLTLHSMAAHKIEVNRRLCILKDLKELEVWIYTLEGLNEEFEHINTIEKQLIKNTATANNIKAIRRKNTLMMATLCKYEQELKTEYEYGKIEYDTTRSKYHEQKRKVYMQFIEECNAFKQQVYSMLKMYKRN